MTDRGTFLAFQKRVQLGPAGGAGPDPPEYLLRHGAQPGQIPQDQRGGRQGLCRLHGGKETQEVVRTFGVDKFGQPLFFPDAGKREESL